MWRQVGLWLLVIGLLGANLWMLGRQLGLSVTPRPKSYAEIVMQEIWQERLKGDPPLGTKIEASKGFKGLRVVIAMERCTDCIAEVLKEWAEAIRIAGLPSLVLVTGDLKEQAQQVLKRWQIEAEIVTDRKGEIAKKLNAFFTPRAYVFKDAQLIWKQERLNVTPHGVLVEVKRR
ncbi:MAG: hypothetical protein ACO2PL_19105 [Armatimonadota bacterium]